VDKVNIANELRIKMKFTIRLVKSFVLLYLLATTQVYAQTGCESGCSIQCIGQINVSLDQDCSTEITPAMGAVGVEYYCNPYYSVDLYDEYGNQLYSNIVGIQYHEKTLTYKVTENECGNSCWGSIFVEYKYPPQIECPDDLTLACGSVSLLDLPVANGACADFDIELFSQEEEKLDCDPEFSSIITRTYRAYDSYGNESFCTHDISIRRLDISSIIFPGPAEISCSDTLMRFDENGIPLPWYTIPLNGSGMADGVPLLCDPNVTDGLFCPTNGDLSGVPLIPEQGAIAIVEQENYSGSEFLIEEVPFDDNVALCNAYLSYTDIEIPNLPCKRKIMRQWEVFEWWCQDEITGGGLQLITIIDDEAPSFECPNDFTVSTDHECGGNVYLEPIDVFDFCDSQTSVMVQYPNGTLFSNGGFVDLDYGYNELTYIVSDACYNQSTCNVNVTVEDNQAPVAICETFKVVSISSNSQTIVYAEPFDNGTFDECGLDRFEVRRMDSLCVAQDTIFGESVSFCCSDVGREVMVVFRAYDWNENFNDCMVRVEVQDKIPPSITCPPDQTVECQDPFDINDLTHGFGMATVTDNCSQTQNISERLLDERNQCGIGTITRFLEIIDEDSLVQASCKQLITVINTTPFVGSGIQWPLDYAVEDVCDIENIDPEDLPAPFNYPNFVGADECALLGYQYQDKVFESANGCAHIKRTWTVINWCGRVDGEYDTWTIPEPQLIEIINTTAPEIEPQGDLFFESQDVNCGGDTIEIVRRAADDCDFLEWYHILRDQNGDTLVYGFSDTLTTFLPVGEFTVEWIVRDGCGNADTDIQNISMINTKAPTPVCINGLSVGLIAMDLDSNGIRETEMAELWASDFDSGSSFSCSNNFTFSLSSDTTVKSVIFDCDDIGRQFVELWVTDVVTGAQDFCVSFVDVQDNNDVDICDDSLSMAIIEGHIYTEELESISDVNVSLGDNMPETISDDSGYYSLGSMPLGSTYDVKAYKNDEHLNGISTLDLIMIQRHILGLETLDGTYKNLAADINGDHSISTLDLIELRKLILGVYDQLPKNTSWQFVDASYQFLDPLDPWASSWPDSYEIDYLHSDMQIDFIAMKTGDVNNSVDLGSSQLIEERNTHKALEFSLSARENINSGNHSMLIKSPNYKGVTGWQMELKFDPFVMEIIDLIPDRLDIVNNVNVLFDNQEGWIRISYNNIYPESFTDSDVLFEIVYNLSSDDNSKEMYPGMIISENSRFKQEAYLGLNEEIGIKLSNSNISSDAIVSVNPNPWLEACSIVYNVEASGKVEWIFYDVSGRKLLSREVFATAGINRLRMTRADFDYTGIIYARMTTNHAVVDSKLLLLD
jgi:hypothetical protein